MVIDFGKLSYSTAFFLFFLSFWCNSKWKRAFESLELSKFRDWPLCTHNATHFWILQASAFLECARDPRTCVLFNFTLLTTAFHWIYPTLEKQKIPA